jgi:hypothetical protein
MARLVPNPLGDLERSLTSLNAELEALRILPEIREQLIEVNENLRTMCAALASMQEAQTPLPGTKTGRRAA